MSSIAAPPSSASRIPLADRITNQEEESKLASTAATTMKKRAATTTTTKGKKKGKGSSGGKMEDSSPKPSSDVTMTPFEEYFATFKKFTADNKFLGGWLIKNRTPLDGDGSEYEYETDEEEKVEDTSKYTKEQMEEMRFIMVTQARADQLEEMRQLILGDQADSCFMMFNTSFSYHISGTWQYVKTKLRSFSKDPAKKLDFLLAYTYMLKEYDVWMHDNEGGMDEVVKGLAGVWKRFLKSKSDEELGWDVEYTKPGVMELLQQFKEAIEQVDDCYDMGTFQYK